MGDHKLFKVNQNAILKSETGDILILKREGKWMLPGGRMEEDETWLEGLQREIREETGIRSFVIEKIISTDISDSGGTYIVTFLCKITGNYEIKLSTEHQEYAWLNMKDIDKYEFCHERIRKILTRLRGATRLGKK